MAVDDDFRPVFVGAARSILMLGDRLEPANNSAQIAPGIVLVAAPEYTCGHSVVRITSGTASFLYAADAFHDLAFDLAKRHAGTTLCKRGSSSVLGLLLCQSGVYASRL